MIGDYHCIATGREVRVALLCLGPLGNAIDDTPTEGALKDQTRILVELIEDFHAPGHFYGLGVEGTDRAITEAVTYLDKLGR
ncbi:hypothetical protein DPM13_07480 [Paracoccus mutanolyticus]|uniref:Uncharacterized protein n=1 Tax=Paracoccus mutanolyticus TaxID=1499308 RepID=A0ABM6WR08_9RHOB|nr:hypothetical protein DPM13_07480 [Paracoccus mutanolyticus]